MNLSNKPDLILRDIKRSVKEGYFDRRRDPDYRPSELMTTSVEDLLVAVNLMSDAERRRYLGRIGEFPRDTGTSLSGETKKTNRKKRWLAR
tara:strand:+ start:255 stop:527 length:273 start_codon:yes stop_codon:yes gene_type:complete